MGICVEGDGSPLVMWDWEGVQLCSLSLYRL